MEFDLSGAILLASSLLAGRRPARAANRSATTFELSRRVEMDRSETRSATSSRAGHRPASDLLASRIVRDRPNSLRYPAR